MMSRRHFVAIAAIINERRGHNTPLIIDEVAQLTLDDLAEELAEYFARDNSAFDRDRFMSAAGAGGG